MKRLFTLLAIFSIPLFIVCILDAVVLSPVFFTQRVWDGISTSNPKMQYFYPNQHVEMDEIGDLGFHTNKAIKKHVIWKTDSLGYRNDSIIHQPDILLIGDSFLAGSTLTQDSTLTSVLRNLTHGKYNIYNIAPATFSSFISLLNHSIIKKPKVIILLEVERFLYMKADTNENYLLNKILNGEKSFAGLNEYLDRFKKANSQKWFNALFKQRTGIGFPSSIDNRMLFFEGKKSMQHDSAIYVGSQRAISLYKEKCKNLGITFLFIPMPNKETVYWELVPYKKQPDLLFRIDTALQKANISTINTLALYNKEKGNGSWLYHFDDTHWNEKGVQLVAKEIVKYLDTLKIFHEHKN
jgi:hypothetical protein